MTQQYSQQVSSALQQWETEAQRAEEQEEKLNVSLLLCSFGLNVPAAERLFFLLLAESVPTAAEDPAAGPSGSEPEAENRQRAVRAVCEGGEQKLLRCFLFSFQKIKTL